jgi:hypothetical protein
MIFSNPNRSLRKGLLGLLLFLAPSAAAAAVHPWETVEITLSASSVPADPYAGEQVWVDLAGPGFSNRCYGFWDGGNRFGVRVMATTPGTWTWRSGSRLDDPALRNQSGAFEAVPWSVE